MFDHTFLTSLGQLTSSLRAPLSSPGAFYFGSTTLGESGRKVKTSGSPRHTQKSAWYRLLDSSKTAKDMRAYNYDVERAGKRSRPVRLQPGCPYAFLPWKRKRRAVPRTCCTKDVFAWLPLAAGYSPSLHRPYPKPCAQCHWKCIKGCIIEPGVTCVTQKVCACD